MKILILFLGIALLCLSSCNINKEFYSLTFKTTTAKAMSDSLKIFYRLLKKLPPMEKNALSDPNIVTRDELGLIAIHYDGKEIIFNLQNEVSWNSVKKDSTNLMKLAWLKPLSNSEKKTFWSIYQLMVENEINAVECCDYGDKSVFFSFRGYPFADRHDMVIIFEDEYKILNNQDRNFLMRSQLIIDKQAGLLLVIQDKERFLRYIYGSYEDIPKRWLIPTEEVFHVK